MRCGAVSSPPVPANPTVPINHQLDITVNLNLRVRPYGESDDAGRRNLPCPGARGEVHRGPPRGHAQAGLVTGRPGRPGVVDGGLHSRPGTARSTPRGE